MYLSQVNLSISFSFKVLILAFLFAVFLKDSHDEGEPKKENDKKGINSLYTSDVECKSLCIVHETHLKR